MIVTDAPVEIGCSFIVRGDVLCLANTSHSDTILAPVSLCCEHILHLFFTCWPDITVW